MTTYQTIKEARKTGKIEELSPGDWQGALDAARLEVQKTAILKATLEGEYYAAMKLLPFPAEDAGRAAHEAATAHGKALRRLSKLVYWRAKVEAGANCGDPDCDAYLDGYACDK